MKIKLEKITKKLLEEYEKSNQLFIWTAFNFSLGAGLGAIGKSMNEPLIPILLPIMDLSKGNISKGIIP